MLWEDLGKNQKTDERIRRMIININVKTNSGKQEVIKSDKGYNVYLKSAPENNRANIELMKVLEKHFKKQVKIKTGFTSRNKHIEVL